MSLGELRTESAGLGRARLILTLSILCFMGYGATFSSIGFFFDPIRAQFGWSGARVASLASAFLLAMSLSAAIAGALLDRWGPRRVILCGVLLAGGGFFLAALGRGMAPFVCGFAIAGAGAGASTYVPSMYIANKMIATGVALAIGIVMCCASAGSAIIPPAIGFITDVAGWRAALCAAGGILIVTCVPVVLLNLSGSTGVASENVEPRADFRSIIALMAQAPPAYYGLVLMQFLGFTGFMGTYFHLIAYLTEIRLPLATSSLLYAAINIICSIGMLWIGWLADRRDAWRVLTGFLILNAASMILIDCVTLAI